MRYLQTITAAATAAFATTALAANVSLIENLDEQQGKIVTVSGNVSWVEDADEFTLADTTGDIEVNLTARRSDIDAGDYVTVTGTVDETLVDELDAATVDVITEDWDTWYAGYYDAFDVYYDLNGFDSTFYETADWDNDIYDDYWILAD